MSSKVLETESVEATRPQKLHTPPPNFQPKPKLSKAERRELQEKQRAAKQDTGVTSSKPPKNEPGNPSKSKEKSAQGGRPGGLSHPVAFTKDSMSTVPDADVLRDLRIFSHFGTSAKVPSHSVSKADIQPAIVRLALQFSSFRIVGANARCIATLAAFKTVSLLFAGTTSSHSVFRSSSNTKPLLGRHFLDTF